MQDRRVAFFFVASVLCGLLTFVAPVGLRWVPTAVSGSYLVLTALAALDGWSARRQQRDPPPREP
jgi:phosphatidylglycerophosphate synthase